MRIFRIFAIMSIFAFLLIRPDFVSRGNIYGWSAADDSNYLAHATAIVFGRFPNYKLEHAPWGPANHAPGVSLLCVPFIAAFSIYDRLTDHPIVEKRTPESIRSSWTAFGMAVGGQFYLLAGIILMFLVCRDLAPRAPPELTLIMSILASGVLIYVDRRPSFTPVYEFFIISAGLYLLSSALVDRPFTRRPRLFWGFAFAVASMIFLVRYNNLFLAYALVGMLGKSTAPGRTEEPVDYVRFYTRYPKPVWITWLGLTVVVISVVLFIAWLKSQGSRLFNTDTVEKNVFSYKGVEFYSKSLFHVLFGVDWGLIFSAPLVLLGLKGYSHLGKDERYFWPLLATLAVNLFITISWGTQASFYGYRYFVYSALPFATLGFAAWMQNGPRTLARRSAMAIALTILPVVMMLTWENAEPFWLQEADSPWGGGGWTNNSYALNVVHALIADRKTFFDAAFGLGGFSLREYEYNANVWAKLWILWTMPLIFGALMIFIEKRILKRRI